MPIDLDLTDFRLLSRLQQEGRTTNAALAEETGMSPSGCVRRVQQLENAGVIEGYHAAVSPEGVGLGLHAFLRVALARNDRKSIQKFLSEIQKWPQVIACYAITGDSDYLLQIVMPDLKSYHDFLMDHLTTNELVSSINTSIVLGTEKQSRKLPLCLLT